MTKIENTMNTQSAKANTKETALTGDRLYNLLFAGKITLKEYLQAMAKSSQKLAA